MIPSYQLGLVEPDEMDVPKMTFGSLTYFFANNDQTLAS